MLKNRLQQLFADNRKPEKYGLRARIDERVNESHIYLYDPVGGMWGVEAKEVVDAVNSLEGETVVLHINCPGGDVFEAAAIASTIRASSKRFIAKIEGLCASAATYIALACNEVEMHDAAAVFFMIHKGWTLEIGNADDMRKMAGRLDQIDGSIAGDYAKKTDMEKGEVINLMAEETWYTAAEAKEAGFVDVLLTGDESIENSTRWNVSAYSKAPKAYTNKKQPEPVEENIDRERIDMRLSMMDMNAQ